MRKHCEFFEQRNIMFKYSHLLGNNTLNKSNERAFVVSNGITMDNFWFCLIKIQMHI